MFRNLALAGRTLLLILALAGASGMSAPAGALSHEDWVMAFIRFVEWPAPSGAGDNTLVICQPRDAPVLDLHGKQVRGLTLQVVRVAAPREIDRCQVFSALAQRTTDWAPWLSALKSQPILAVGQGAHYCEVGGAICLIIDEKTGVEKYQLNLDSLSRGGFKVRSQLLRQQRPSGVNKG